MLRRLTRISLLFVLLLTSEVWAIGLGNIKLDSALNEPLRAEIDLLSATPDELAGLTVTLASSDTFARYGIERPFYLQDIQFHIVNGGSDGSFVQIRSPAPITEPFLTFLVEATWQSGRLLREYTVLLDPPTYAPPAVQQAPVVTAPRRSTPSDSARIQRQPAEQASRPAPEPTQQPSQPAPIYRPEPQPPVDDAPYDTTTSGDYVVARHETLWSISTRMRPDSRLTINQTMLAIFEANPDAFGGNINILSAGAALRIPSADEVFQIQRGDALDEVKRQHRAWGGAYRAPETTTRPSLTLVPPDEEPAGTEFDDAAPYEPLSREEEIENRISELEAADVPDQQSLIEIRNNELAGLRQELANIRGEIYEPPVDDVIADTDETTSIDDALPDQDEIIAGESDDVIADDVAADDEAVDTSTPSTVIQTSPTSDKSIVDQVLEIVTGIWGIIGGTLILVAGGLFWFMRRDRGDEDDDQGPWEALDADEISDDAISPTVTMEVPTPEEAIVVVEQDSGINPLSDDTVEAPITVIQHAASEIVEEVSGSFDSIEDTFSSETAVNLDQSDPIAEADFHMAYGLYDQAADLINGALEMDSTDKGLMSKLCEIYFVWGNRDAFIESATRLKSAVGDAENAEWDKIVIMGQQIAADNPLFAGAAVAGATREVDLSFDDGADEAASLDMDFGADEETEGDVDFLFEAPDETGEDSTAESPTIESMDVEKTAEMPAPTVESPTIEEQFGSFEGTSDLPSLDESLHQAIADSGQDEDATAEMNVDELDLDVDGLAETEVAVLDDLDATGQIEALPDLAEITGRNPAVSMDDTGVRRSLDLSDTSIGEGLDLDDLAPTQEMLLAADETGRAPMHDAQAEQVPSDEVDQSLLDATGHTQILGADMTVETATDLGDELSDADATLVAPGMGDDETIEESLSGDAETMLAPLEDDDEDFDFAKTEALPVDSFTGNSFMDETGEMPELAGTDVDIDLDDLTAALQVSEDDETIQIPGDDETVEQPRPPASAETAAVPTMSLSPEDMSDELQDARTMTEVGTKLDLARAYVDMGDPAGARSILDEVLDEGDESQKQQAQQLLDSLPS